MQRGGCLLRCWAEWKGSVGVAEVYKRLTTDYGQSVERSQMFQHGGKSILLIALMGCATTLSSSAASVIEADPARVRHCAFLGTIRGNSAISGMRGSTGRQNSRNEVLEEAAQRGANRVVWVTEDSGFGGSTATGRAYRCPTRGGR